MQEKQVDRQAELDEIKAQKTFSDKEKKLKKKEIEYKIALEEKIHNLICVRDR